MSVSHTVPLSQSALLVVDAQDSFKVGPQWDRRDNLQFETKLASVIAAYRAAKLPVIFFLHVDGDDGFAIDSPELRLMDFIKQSPDEPLFVKKTRNCFTSTGLQPLLLSLGVLRVAVTGISMEQCCETTTRVASDLGFAVDFVTDCTMTFPIPNHDVPGEELGVEAIRERTEYALRGRFARIVTAAQLVGELKEVNCGAVA